MDKTLPWEDPGQSLCSLACLRQRSQSRSVLWRALRDSAIYKGGYTPPSNFAMCGTSIGKVYNRPQPMPHSIIPDKNSCMIGYGTFQLVLYLDGRYNTGGTSYRTLTQNTLCIRCVSIGEISKETRQELVLYSIYTWACSLQQCVCAHARACVCVCACMQGVSMNHTSRDSKVCRVH